MDQRISTLTLGVADMERSAKFYTALGWKRVPTNEEIVVYDLIGQSLGLYPKAKLCEDIGIPVGEAASGNGFSGDYDGL